MRFDSALILVFKSLQKRILFYFSIEFLAFFIAIPLIIVYSDKVQQVSGGDKMVADNVSLCPECGGDLKYFDSVPRIVRTRGRISSYTKIRRLRCSGCYKVHREIPDYIFPYKQYDAEIIIGVLEGFITSDTIGYEDYPCEATMARWKTRKIHLL